MTDLLLSLGLKVGAWAAKALLRSLVKRLSPNVVAWLQAGVKPAAVEAAKTDNNWDDKAVAFLGPILEAGATTTPPNGR